MEHRSNSAWSTAVCSTMSAFSAMRMSTRSASSLARSWDGPWMTERSFDGAAGGWTGGSLSNSAASRSWSCSFSATNCSARALNLTTSPRADASASSSSRTRRSAASTKARAHSGASLANAATELICSPASIWRVSLSTAAILGYGGWSPSVVLSCRARVRATSALSRELGLGSPLRFCRPSAE